MRLQLELFLLDRKWIGPLGFALVRVDAGVGSLLLRTSFEGFCCLLHCLGGLLMPPRLPDLALGLQARDWSCCTGYSLQQTQVRGSADQGRSAFDDWSRLQAHRLQLARAMSSRQQN